MKRSSTAVKVLDKLLKTMSDLILNYITDINVISLKSKQELLNFF